MSKRQKARAKDERTHSGGKNTPEPRSDATSQGVRLFLLFMVTLILVARPLFPSEGTDLGDDVAPTMLLLGSVLIANVFALGQPRFSIRFHWVDAALLATVLWTVLAGVQAVMFGTPRPAMNMLWQWVAYFVLWELVRQLKLAPRERRALVAGMVALASGIAVYGLYQYFVELPQLRAAYDARRIELLRELGWEELLEDLIALARFENRLFSREPLATFALTNSVAGFLLPWIILLCAIVFPSGKSSALAREGNRPLEIPPSGKSTKWRALLPWAQNMTLWGGHIVKVLALGSLLYCLVLTKSRSAFLALIVGILLLFTRGISSTGRRARWTVATVFGITFAALVAAVLTRGVDWAVLAEATKSLGYRWQYWQATVQIIADNPFLGCGPGNFRYAYTRYKLPEASEEISDPHNFILEIAATAGIPAAIFFGAALVSVGWALHRRLPALGDISEVSPAKASLGPTGNEAVPAGSSPWNRELWPIALGWLLAWPTAYWLGLLSSAPGGWTFLLVGLPAALVVLLVLSPWVRNGVITPGAMSVATLTMAINWLAAGGLSFPGVAGSFWLLWAMILDFRESEDSSPLQNSAQKSLWFSRWFSRILPARGGPLKLPGWVGFLFLAIWGAILVLFYETAYSPVLQARGFMAQAASVRRLSIDQAKQRYRQAAMADPWAFEPWMRLVELWMCETPAGQQGQRVAPPDAAQQVGSLHFQTPPGSRVPTREARAEELNSYVQELIRRAPNHHGAFWLAALAYQQLFQETQDREALDQAVTFARRAIEFYPHQARYHAGLAELLAAMGEKAAAQQAAQKALWLHHVTPHIDRKLPEETLRALESLVP